jgi:hypothetical protein
MTNCDQCGEPAAEVRRLPWNEEDDYGGASLLCRACFDAEMQHRRELNAKAEPGLRWTIPTWESLKVYETA